MKTLKTGVIIKNLSKDSGVVNPNYDTMYDQRTLDIDVKADVFETLSNIFKPL